jgi:hypothetical protein
MQYTLGIDETKAGLPFVRMIAPTEFDQVISIMLRRIKGYHGGIDFLNPGLWLEIGAEGGPVKDYLTYVMDIARTTKTAMTPENAPDFNTQIKEKYGLNSGYLIEYSKAYLECVETGEVPKEIREPWSYEPTSVAQDVGSGVTAGVKTLGPLILGAVAVYALVSAFLPNLVGKLAHR